MKNLYSHKLPYRFSVLCSLALLITAVTLAFVAGLVLGGEYWWLSILIFVIGVIPSATIVGWSIVQLYDLATLASVHTATEEC